MFELPGLAIAIMWVTFHFGMILLLPRGAFKKVVFVFFISVLSLIYILKPYTYDLIWYLKYFDVPFPNEILFYFPSLFLGSKLSWQPESILLFWQFLIFSVLYFSISVYVKNDKIMISMIILSSLFFVLGSQNGLRQGASLSFIMLTVANLYSKKWVYACVAAITAVFLHNSGVGFLIISVLFLLQYHFYSFRNISNRPSPMFFSSLTGLLVGVSVMLLSKAYYADTIYVDSDMFAEADRSSSALKMVAIAISFATSEYLLGGLKLSKESIFNRGFRAYLFFLLLPMSLLPEAFARTTYVYYVVELVLICCLVHEGFSRARLAGISLLFFYGVAPNAIHIVSGLV